MESPGGNYNLYPFRSQGGPSVALIVAVFLGFTYVNNYVNFLQV